MAELTRKQRDREKARARQAFRELSAYDRHTLIDQLVLDDFDWTEWFTQKPTGAFMNELWEQLQYWEETLQ